MRDVSALSRSCLLYEMAVQYERLFVLCSSGVRYRPLDDTAGEMAFSSLSGAPPWPVRSGATLRVEQQVVWGGQLGPSPLLCSPQPGRHGAPLAPSGGSLSAAGKCQELCEKSMSF